MQTPEELRYSKEHVWVKAEGSECTAGITDYAQGELNDIVFVELPEVGRTVSAGEAIAAVESVKAVNDIYAPVSGKVSAVNDALEDQPELINQDPYGEGWMVKIEMSDPGEVGGLMTAADYSAATGDGD